MSLTNRWGNQNSLIRRVRQHSTMTTLFRAANSNAVASLPFTIGTVIEPMDASQQDREHDLEPGAANTGDGWELTAGSPQLNTPSRLDTAAIQRRPVPFDHSASVVQPIATNVDQANTVTTISRAVLPSVTPALRGLAALSTSQPSTTQPVSRVALPDAPMAVPTPRQPPTIPPEVLPFQPAEDVRPRSVVGASLPVPSAGPTRPSVQRTSTPPEPQPTSDGIDDPTWARLQAIVRKHKAQEASTTAVTPGETPPAPPHAAPAPTVVPVAPTQVLNPIQRHSTLDTTAQHGSSTSAVAQVAGQVEPGAMPPPTVAEPSQFSAGQRESGLQARPEQTSATRRASDPLGVQRQSLDPATPRNPGSEEPSSRPEMVEVTALATPVQSPQPWSNQLQAEERETGWTLPPIATEQTQSVLTTTTASAAGGMDAQTPAWQPTTPLQNAWPVQRLVDNGVETASLPTTTPAYVGPPPPEPPHLRQQLAAIPTGQPTDASVDLVLPRRPRPVRPGQTEPTSAPDARSHAPLQQQADPASAHPAYQSGQAATGQIATEIGPLPTDLWQLIGETPPPIGLRQQQVSPATTVVQAASATINRGAPLITPASIVSDSGSAATLQTQAMPSAPSVALDIQATETNPYNDTPAQLREYHTMPSAPLVAPQQQITGADSYAAAPVQPSVHTATTEAHTPVDAEPLPDPEKKNGARPPSERNAENQATTARLGDEGLTIQRAIAQAEQSTGQPSVTTETAPGKAMARGNTREQPSIVMQRQASALTDPDSASTPSTESDASSTNDVARPEAAQAQIDTNELARQVYTQVKRKLAVERERLRLA